MATLACVDIWAVCFLVVCRAGSHASYQPWCCLFWFVSQRSAEEEEALTKNVISFDSNSHLWVAVATIAPSPSNRTTGKLRKKKRASDQIHLSSHFEKLIWNTSKPTRSADVHDGQYIYILLWEKNTKKIYTTWSWNRCRRYALLCEWLFVSFSSQENVLQIIFRSVFLWSDQAEMQIIRKTWTYEEKEESKQPALQCFCGLSTDIWAGDCKSRYMCDSVQGWAEVRQIFGASVTQTG